MSLGAKVYSNIPSHLRQYVVEQNYSQYTEIDQATWRFIMRQLKSYLGRHAHPVYRDGLERVGISTEKIPSIELMSEKLSAFGWRAIPVSGFIPPTAFMELQSLGFLPIASNMRSIEHLEYTPAPDIVHEAAGHAPILVDPAFSSYLKEYAQVAKMAIISVEDLQLYEAIRNLSDIKENHSATSDEIEKATADLEHVKKNMGEPSEAALLARMNWWTAEYGLIGDVESPKLYGAGLLSSVGESRSCLSPDIVKLPMSLDCLNYNYDITEPQPQLFLTPNFETLSSVLKEFALEMAFNKGGVLGLRRILAARTVNTVMLNSSLQISGKLQRFLTDDEGRPSYLSFSGPVQICKSNREIFGHGRTRHGEGFGTPVGNLVGTDTCLSEMSDLDLMKNGINVGGSVQLFFKSGICVKGHLKHILKVQGQNQIFTFNQCSVFHSSNPKDLLFQPEWGEFDLAAGSTVTSVFGGPADRENYGDLDNYVAKTLQVAPLFGARKILNETFKEIRRIREGQSWNSEGRQLDNLYQTLNQDLPKEWLAHLELYELVIKMKSPPSWKLSLRNHLEQMGREILTHAVSIHDGLKLIEEKI